MWDVHYISVMVHTGNSIYVLLNILITAMPMRLLHYIHYVIYGLLYTLFTFIYHHAGGTNAHHQPYIYDAIDWSRPLFTLRSLVGIVVLSLLSWLALVGLTALRQKVADRLYDTLTPSASSTDEESSGADHELQLMTNYERQQEA